MTGWQQSAEQSQAGMMDVDLRQFDEGYRRAQASDAGSTGAMVSAPRFELPDGQYQVVVDSVELTTTKNTGKPLLKWRLRITCGAFENRWIFKNRVISENTIDWVKKEMLVCGMELEPFSSLPLRLRDLVNVRLAVSKVKRGEWDNVYLNKRLSPVAEGEIAELADDLPF